jgi:hypothetical protein
MSEPTEDKKAGARAPSPSSAPKPAPRPKPSPPPQPKPKPGREKLVVLYPDKMVRAGPLHRRRYLTK